MENTTNFPPAPAGAWRYRQATLADLDQIMGIIQDAQRFIAAQGFDQWQDGYPTIEVIRADIEAGIGRVVCEGARCLATGALLQQPEPTYRVIEAGGWRCGERYAAIHRVAVSDAARGRGVGGWLFAQLEAEAKAAGFSALRVDTHAENQAMQHLVGRAGFGRCGVIHLANGAARVAFDKAI